MTGAEHFYQAVGELLATLAIAENGTKWLQTEQQQFRAFIPSRLKDKYLENYQGRAVYFRAYPKFTSVGLAFEIVSLSLAPQRGDKRFVLQGDWVEPGRLKIWRNAIPGKINEFNWQPRLLNLYWEGAPEPDGTFWQLEAQLVDSTFEVVAASGPFPNPPRWETPPDWEKKSRPKPSLSEAPLKSEPTTSVTSKNWEEPTPVSGKLELIIKLNTLPEVKQSNGRCHFRVDCDGRVFQVSVRPKQWNKLETASKTYASWVAAIGGKLGASTADGFVLEEPNIQVFERADKSTVPAPDTNAENSVPPPVEKNEIKTQEKAKPAATSPREKAEDLVSSPASSEVKLKKVGKFKVDVR